VEGARESLRRGIDRVKTTGHIETMPKPNVREEILTAGVDTLHRHGFNATSVQDITDAAGVPKGSFYNHFESKEVLGAEVVRRFMQNRRAHLAILRDANMAPLSRLRKYFEGMNQIVAKNNYSHGCLLGNFGAELSDQSPLIRERLAQAFEDWSKLIANVIAESQAAGDMSKDFSPKTLAGFFLNGWEGALLRARVDKSRAPLDQFLAVNFAKVLT
jgi:TetR/AcrR family transcriptional repressor of nem operon